MAVWWGARPGEPVVEELLLDWLDPILTVEEQDRLTGWHLGLNSSQQLSAVPQNKND